MSSVRSGMVSECLSPSKCGSPPMRILNEPNLTDLDHSYCRLGIEGIVMFKGEPRYDADNYTLTVPSPENEDVTIAVFDKVTVLIEVEKDKNTQRGRVKMTLVDPPVAHTL